MLVRPTPVEIPAIGDIAKLTMSGPEQFMDELNAMLSQAPKLRRKPSR